MSTHKGDRSFRIEVPRRRRRNLFALSVARGEAQKPRRMCDKKYKDSMKEKESWKKEDWGEEED
jgi:hypothetical protein